MGCVCYPRHFCPRPLPPVIPNLGSVSRLYMKTMTPNGLVIASESSQRMERSARSYACFAKRHMSGCDVRRPDFAMQRAIALSARLPRHCQHSAWLRPPHARRLMTILVPSANDAQPPPASRPLRSGAASRGAVAAAPPDPCAPPLGDSEKADADEAAGEAQQAGGAAHIVRAQSLPAGTDEEAASEEGARGVQIGGAWAPSKCTPARRVGTSQGGSAACAVLCRWRCSLTRPLMLEGAAREWGCG